MDLSPRRSPTVSAKIAAVPKREAAPKPAEALHSRVKPAAHVIDLRSAGKLALELPPAPTHKAPPKSLDKPKAVPERRHIARFSDQFDRAKKYGRSNEISRFGPSPEMLRDKFGNPSLEGLANHEPQKPGPSHIAPPVRHDTLVTPTAPQMPHLTATQHEAMAKLPRPEPTPTRTLPFGSRSQPKIPSGASRVLTTAAAIVVMAGYVWLQNYPKLALQSADSQAGLQASLPGYMPSSYSLSHTTTEPGLVTLSFASPSSTQPLTISQHATTWDASSLLDNYVAKNADDYAAVNGEGLTVYMFGNNQAAWVNHGIWFSIAGATRLSRDQILKIAYSL
jgi:hypothetical protein